MIKTTIYIPEEEMAALDSLAKSESRPKSQLIREALSQYVAERGRNLPSWIGMIDNDDSTLTARNAQKWLKANWRPE